MFNSNSDVLSRILKDIPNPGENTIAKLYLFSIGYDDFLMDFHLNKHNLIDVSNMNKFKLYSAVKSSEKEHKLNCIYQMSEAFNENIIRLKFLCEDVEEHNIDIRTLASCLYVLKNKQLFDIDDDGFIKILDLTGSEEEIQEIINPSISVRILVGLLENHNYIDFYKDDFLLEWWSIAKAGLSLRIHEEKVVKEGLETAIYDVKSQLSELEDSLNEQKEKTNLLEQIYETLDKETE